MFNFRRLKKHLKRCPFLEHWRFILSVVLVIGIPYFLIKYLIGFDVFDSNFEAFKSAEKITLTQTLDIAKRGTLHNLAYGGKHTWLTIWLIFLHNWLFLHICKAIINFFKKPEDRE